MRLRLGGGSVSGAADAATAAGETIAWVEVRCIECRKGDGNSEPERNTGAEA
jgi:hypothetical protein